MGKYADKFAEYLRETCRYPESSIGKNTYRYGGKDYDRVEVMDGELIIQAFVLMSGQECENLDKFPFHRTYYQRNVYGFLVNPACNVAVYDEEHDKWHIHGTNNLRHELTSPTLLDYDKAKGRFAKRFSYLGNDELRKTVRRLSIGLLCVVILYVTAHILSINGLLGDFSIPLDATTVSIFIVLMCLLLIPPLIPYIRSLTVGQVGIELRDQNK